MEKRELLSVINRYAGNPSTGGIKKSQTYHSTAAQDAEASFLQSVSGKQMYAPGEAAVGAATAGMPDPVKILSLKQTAISSTTELYMSNKGIRLLHPNFKKFTALAILFLGDNELTSLVGLLPENGRKTKDTPKANNGEDGFLPEHVRDSSTFKFIQAQKKGANGGGHAALGGVNSGGGSKLGGLGDTMSTVVGGNSGTYPARGSSPGENSSDAPSRYHKSTNGGGNGGPVDLNATLAEAPSGCRRLKKLFLSGNKLTTLDGDLKHLKYLETLLLASNNLSNMSSVVDSLKHLRFLKQLDLFGNPLCEEQHYRLYVIAAMPALEILDRSTITPSERRKATELFGDKLANYEIFLEKQGKGLPDAAARKKNKREGRRGSLASSMVSSSGDTSSNIGGGGGGAGGKEVPMTLSAINSVDGVGVPKSLMRMGGGGGSRVPGSGASQFETPRSAVSQSNASNLLFHASGKNVNERTVGFGSTFVVPPPVQRAQPISASVANLEMKCTLVKAEEAARKRREKDKLSAEIYELQDQRKKFHQLWEFGASQNAPPDPEAEEKRKKEFMEQSYNEVASSSSKRRGSSKNLKAMQIAAEEQHRREEQKRNEAVSVGRKNHLASLEVLDRNVSRLFNVNAAEALDPRVSNLIELQRRKEETGGNVMEDEAAEALNSQISATIHHLLPPRDADAFSSAHRESLNASLDADRRNYTNEILRNMLFPESLSVLRSQFEELGGTVSPNLLPTFLQVACAGGVLGTVYDAFFAALVVAFPPIKKKDNLDLQLPSNSSTPAPPLGAAPKSGIKGRSPPPMHSKNGTAAAIATSTSMTQSMNNSTSASAKTFRTLPLDTILQALCHFAPAVQICFNHVEQRALISLQKHDYGDLKPLQMRKNNLHTHMEALKASSSSSSTGGGGNEIVTLTKFPRLDSLV